MIPLQLTHDLAELCIDEAISDESPMPESIRMRLVGRWAIDWWYFDGVRQDGAAESALKSRPIRSLGILDKLMKMKSNRTQMFAVVRGTQRCGSRPVGHRNDVVRSENAEELIQATKPQKPCFRSSENDDPLMIRSEWDSKLKESVEHLCRQKRLKDVIQLLEKQVHQPSAVLYTTILQLCIEKRALDEGKRVHAHIKRSGFVPGIFISNKILDLYCKCESISDAQTVFDEMGEKDLCSWNILISGYAKMGWVSEARNLFDEMPKRDNFSWTAMISGYVKHKEPANALELYRLMQRNEKFTSNKFTVSSALAAGCYTVFALGINDARHIFDRTVGKDIVSWTTMIDRYFGDGRWEEGLSLFSDFLSSGIRPNDFTFAGVLNACAHQTAEELGRQVHGHMTRTGFDPFSFAASALVHMYAKCGSVETAHKVFKWLPRPDLVSWTSLINGYAQNGQPHEALQLFDRLLKSGNQPDHITFIGVLSACTHAGLVDKGLEYFYSIKEKHGLSHTADQYACIIDLLSRSGRFKEAEGIINKMPMEPDKFLWASLLGGCRIHGNYELAERAAKALFQIEPENAATYVTLANIYATAGKWSEVARIRKLMDERGVVKKPGMSWINVKKKVHSFLVGDQSHPRSKEIFDFLGKVSKRMKEEGYVPHTNYVLHDVEEEQKEQNLSYHSEKLAVAFGIISTPAGAPIKVFKNLRTCVDCHTAIKFISSIAERKIIVRDSSRRDGISMRSLLGSNSLCGLKQIGRPPLSVFDNSRCAGKCKLRSSSKLITYSRTSIMESKLLWEVQQFDVLGAVAVPERSRMISSFQDYPWNPRTSDFETIYEYLCGRILV
ncbi:Pentatricopeptide repeat-containing protein [Sesamum angolense]|uniref:Pentatricopeptide repeat-containing protein n=1 Tax=Sesamum angolense TaxID=2727404 RepID=A0AAE2C5T9_9LAMI|nr:Pentatricopeptide repeat-containing protein [Sesamum angolense]